MLFYSAVQEKYNGCFVFIPTNITTRAGPKYSTTRIFVSWVGIQFLIVTFRYTFFNDKKVMSILCV